MKICFATNNKKKIEEVVAELGSSLTILSLADIGCTEELPETGATLEANALEKAQYVKDKYGIDCFADDTGLEVYALGGAPGVYSGRFAGEPRSDQRNMDLLLKKLDGLTERKARFKTVFSLILGSNHYSFEGIAEGEITTERSGEGGFGYDPIFKPNGMDKTFAELSMQEKNEISHRGMAVRKLIYFLSKL
ncbi:non-canonical purine NTP diphosphatase [Pararhodonellum marinum]|uniref:non-canonical purine NTP diphosphatase n=1 Tax=Pararhodonellum marinum TaxID=2755358 RepID=UPI0018902CD2|nr:non-canonical purine NTP diphosphatase [Pararhodonellum marinum]